jgi:hypothetical protein
MARPRFLGWLFVLLLSPRLQVVCSVYGDKFAPRSRRSVVDRLRYRSMGVRLADLSRTSQLDRSTRWEIPTCFYLEIGFFIKKGELQVCALRYSDRHLRATIASDIYNPQS